MIEPQKRRYLPKIASAAQAIQGGIHNVVASSGTALTPAQARLLKRFASKVVLSFDPDAAGKGAAVRSSELLVAEGFQVNVAMMPKFMTLRPWIEHYSIRPPRDRICSGMSTGGSS